MALCLLRVHLSTVLYVIWGWRVPITSSMEWTEDLVLSLNIPGSSSQPPPAFSQPQPDRVIYGPLLWRQTYPWPRGQVVKSMSWCRYPLSAHGWPWRFRLVVCPYGSEEKYKKNVDYVFSFEYWLKYFICFSLLSSFGKMSKPLLPTQCCRNLE